MQIVIELRLNKEILQNAGMSQYPPYETCDLGYAHVLPEHRKSPWIDVKDLKPPLDKPFLCFDGFSMETAILGPEGWYIYTTCNCCNGYCSPEITHWMPLPEPPK